LLRLEAGLAGFAARHLSVTEDMTTASTSGTRRTPG
jgi:hypothetical protein